MNIPTNSWLDGTLVNGGNFLHLKTPGSGLLNTANAKNFNANEKEKARIQIYKKNPMYSGIYRLGMFPVFLLLVILFNVNVGKK